MTAARYLRLLYPTILANGAVAAQVDEFVLTARPFAPTCLSADAQEMAVAHYAAYLMMRANPCIIPPAPGGRSVVRREKIGDEEVEYTTAAALESVVTPAEAYQAWKTFADICAGGPLVGTAFPQRGGGGDFGLFWP